MKFEQSVKLQKQSTDGTISMTLPKIFAKQLNWNVKDVVTVELDSNNPNILTIRKKS